MGDERPGARRGVPSPVRRALTVAAVVAMAVTALLLAPVDRGPVRAGAAEPPGPPGVGTAHPRVLFAPGDEDLLRARLDREPYRTVFLRSHQRAASYDTTPLGDMSIVAQRNLSRAAKVHAFEYALDRTVVGGEVVPYASPADREAAGDRVRALLLNLYPRSRLAVPPPLGGFDRDINTSEEILNYVTAFDTMLGAGYDFGADHDAIVDLLASVTGELHTNFVDPASAGGYADLMQNNHRSKSGASLAVAAVVLADEVPAAADWWDDGILLVDDVLRYMLVTGDGAYGEGPYYYRYTMQNLAPLIATWDRHLGASSWTARGIEVPSPSATPLFARTQRWMLDTTVPDGTMAPVDDGNPGRSYYFGVLPSSLPDTAAGYWRWADTPQALETDGSVELGPDTVVAYDDSVVPRPPWWSPTQFYVEGGTAVLRSAWSDDALMTVVLGEHDTASQFGRDRAGLGRWPQSHEHPDPGSFMLYGFGERLALDPGYLTFPTRTKVNKPEDHNMVLVDGAGPADYLQASLAWRHDLEARPPADGHATLSSTIDSPGLAATSVVSDYRDTAVARRFVQVDDRYLVVADSIEGPGGSLSWMLHGNGGGSSGGTFEQQAFGGRWTIGGAQLESAIAVVDQPVVLDEVLSIHEVPYGQERTHAALRATVPAGRADAVQVLYPSAAGDPAPVVERVAEDGAATIVVTDASSDRKLVVRRVGGTAAGVQLVDEHLDGTLRSLYADDVSQVEHRSMAVRASTAGSIGIRPTRPGATSVVAETADPAIQVTGLGYAPASVDGACGVERRDDTTTVVLNRERRIELRSDAGNARPAADAGPFQRVEPGAVVTLDGTASCDLEGSALRPSWELVSAPAGSSWTLTGSDTMHPSLVADRVGPYRVRLVVTDAAGARSLEQEVLVIAGPRCGDGVDNDLDGLIDTDDVGDCDGIDPPPPTTTTTSTTTVDTTTTTATAPTSTTSQLPAATTTTPGSGQDPPAAVVAARPAIAVRSDPRFAG